MHVFAPISCVCPVCVTRVCRTCMSPPTHPSVTLGCSSYTNTFCLPHGLTWCVYTLPLPVSTVLSRPPSPQAALKAATVGNTEAVIKVHDIMHLGLFFAWLTLQWAAPGAAPWGRFAACAITSKYSRNACIPRPVLQSTSPVLYMGAAICTKEACCDAPLEIRL